LQPSFRPTRCCWASHLGESLVDPGAFVTKGRRRRRSISNTQIWQKAIKEKTHQLLLLLVQIVSFFSNGFIDRVSPLNPTN
jgi:hypothetical protein